jgi:hypothetical protein
MEKLFTNIKDPVSDSLTNEEKECMNEIINQSSFQGRK